MRLRKENNMTQEEMAEKLGVSNRTVSRWENGKNLPDASMYASLCSLLNISLTELFNGEKIETGKIVETAEENIISTIEHTEKQIKFINRRFIFVIIVSVVFFVGMFIIFDSIYYSSCPYYSGDVSQWQNDFPPHSAYQLALSKEGKPVFVNPKKALKQAKVDYSDAITHVKSQYHLLPVSKYYYKPYGTYGAQIITDDEMLRKQGYELSKFIDIYENSF